MSLGWNRNVFYKLNFSILPKRYKNIVIYRTRKLLPGILPKQEIYRNLPRQGARRFSNYVKQTFIQMYHDYHDNHNPVRHISFAIVYTTIRFLRFILLHAISCWYNKHSLFIMKASRLLPSETVGSSVSSRRASRDRLFSDVSLQPTLEGTWDKTFSLKRTLACTQDSGKELATCYITFSQSISDNECAIN